ncbi:WD-40 repeat-containing protein [Zostera marina]|uniref:WD-40 repeat-containing protein n=1 Tax=Zostera marina TaxID=29655 RepID=A0A0K9PNQ5_ZOSMR|nr:WD-40 repeat-containing protein [Zostera marina]
MSQGKGGSGDQGRNQEDGDVFLEEDDVIQEIHFDEEELPEADANDNGDGDDDDFEMEEEEPDDSVHVFTGHTGEVYAVACSPTDATLVATGGGDDKGFMWRIGHGDWYFLLQGHEPHNDSVSAVAFSHDGRLLASGSFDGTIYVWDTTLISLKCTFKGPDSIEWLRWYHKGHVLLAGSENSIGWIWNVDKPDRNPYLLIGHANTVTCGDFTPDGKTICTGSSDKTLRIWNTKSRETIHVVKGYQYHSGEVTCLLITPDSSIVITGSSDGSLYMVNILTGKVVSSMADHTKSIECIGMSESYNWIATGSMDGKLNIWDLQHNSSPHWTGTHEEGVVCLLWLGKSKYIASGCLDGKVRIWDCLSGVCARTFDGHQDDIQDLAISCDKNHIVSVSKDTTARVFEISEFLL